MPAPIAQIITPLEIREDLVERIAHRIVKPPIAICEPNPEWPIRYQEVKTRIENALGDFIVEIAHVGSTSVPGLPAKDTIDVDLTLRDIKDEASYVKPLEKAGFRFLLREPAWHGHRFFDEDWPGAYNVNLHVFGPDCPETARHRIFRDWLRKTPADLKLYADVKREAAGETARAGETLLEYNNRKTQTILDILDRAFRELGYIK